MTNQQVFNAFATKRIAKGGSVRTEAIDGGNGVALFSYGTPIAINTDEGIVFDLRKYGVTTTKHQSGAARACRHYKYVSPQSFRELCRDKGVYLGAAR
jgi:hypothetical protein